MELRQLRYFVETANGLNFRKAAEKLYVTQPAISRQIAELENELRVALFIRDKRHVALTDAGEILLERARQILALADEIPSAVRKHELGERSSIMLATAGPSGPLVTEILRVFCDRYPGVRLELRQGDSTRDVAIQVADGDIDAAFGEIEELERHDLEAQLLQEYEVEAIVHSSHPFASRECVPLKDLATESIVAHPSIWSVVKPHLKEAGFRPHLLGDGMPRPNTAMLVLLRMRAAVGLWISGFSPNPEGTVCIRLEPAPVLPYGLAWRRGDRSAAVSALVGLIRELRADGSVIAR